MASMVTRAFKAIVVGVGIVVLAAGTLLVSLHPVMAQFTQQGSKLVGTGAVGSAQQGSSAAVAPVDADVMKVRNSFEQTFKSQAITHELVDNTRKSNNNVDAAIQIATDTKQLKFLDAPDPRFLTQAQRNKLIEARTTLLRELTDGAYVKAGNGDAPGAQADLMKLSSTPGLTNAQQNSIREAHSKVDEIQRSVVEKAQIKNRQDAYTTYHTEYAKYQADPENYKLDRKAWPATPEGTAAYNEMQTFVASPTFVPPLVSKVNTQEAVSEIKGDYSKFQQGLNLSDVDAAHPSKVNAALATKYGSTISLEDRQNLAEKFEAARTGGPTVPLTPGQ